MDSGGPERIGPYDFNDYSQVSLMEAQPGEQPASNVHYADEGWVQTDTFVDLSEKFSSDKPEEFEEHLRKRKSEVSSQQKVNKLQKFTFEEAVNQAESLLENDIDLVNKLLKQRYEEDDGKVESHENVFLDVRLHNQSDEFVEKIFGGKISQRFAETSNHKVANRLQETEKKTQQKQKKLKPQAKIIPVRRESFHVEEQQPESPDKKPPYPMEMEFETVQKAVAKPIDNFRENQFPQEALVDKRGTAVGRALNELFDTSHPSNQWSPNYDVPDRSNDPNAMKIISVGVTEDEPTEESVQHSKDQNKEVLPAAKVKRPKQTPTKPIEETGDVQTNKSGVSSKKPKPSTDKQSKLQKTSLVDTPVELKEEDVEVSGDQQTPPATTANLNTQMNKALESEVESVSVLNQDVVKTTKKSGSKSTKLDESIDAAKQLDKPESKKSTKLDDNQKFELENDSKLLDESVDAAKQLNKPGRKSTNLDDNQKSEMAKQLDKPESNSTNLDAEFNKQPDTDSTDVLSSDHQQLSSKKQLNKLSKKSTNLDASFDKPSEVENDSKLLNDVDKLTSTKQLNKPGSKSTNLDVDLNKPSEVENDSKLLNDVDKLTSKKQLIKLSKKSTELDVDLTKSSEAENDSKFLDDSQQLSSKKQLNKPGSRSTNLDVDLSKSSGVENDIKVLDDTQKSETAKTTQKPSKKSTELDVDLSKPSEVENDSQQLSSTKTTQKPGSKSTKLDASFDKQDENEISEVSSPDHQQLSSTKTTQKPSKKSTNLDVDLNKPSNISDHQEIITPDHQKSETAKQMSKPGSRSTELDVNLTKSSEAENDSKLLDDTQKSEMAKTTQKPGSKSTNLDVDLNKPSEVENNIKMLDDSQQLSSTKQLNRPGSKSTNLDVDLNRPSEVENDSKMLDDTQQLSSKKQLNKLGSKLTNLDVSFDKEPESESSKLSSSDGQKTKLEKQVNEPGSKSTKLNADLNKQLENEVSEVSSLDDQKTKLEKQLNEPSQTSTKLDATLSKPDVSIQQEIVTSDQQQSKMTKQVNEPGSKSTKLNIALNKQPEVGSDEMTSIDDQVIDVSKQMNEFGKKSTKLDAALNKRPETDSTDVLSKDKQSDDVLKKLSEPGSKSTKLNIDLDKQPEVGSDEMTSIDDQVIDVSKQMNEFGKKSTKLDAAFDKQSESEGDDLTSIDHQKSEMAKRVNEPGSKLAKLDAAFDKQPETDSTDVLSPDQQQSKTTKQLNEFGKKSTKLDIDLNKQPETDSTDILSKDIQKSEMATLVNEPSQKSTKLDAAFDKQSESEGNNLTSIDGQSDNVLKKLSEPSQKSTKLDAAFDKQPEVGSDEMLSSDHQKSEMAKRVNEPGSESTKLDAEFDKQPESGGDKLTSIDGQHDGVSKKMNEPGSKSTKLDAEFDKQPEVESKEISSPDQQQSKTTKSTSEPSQKSTKLDAEFNKPDVYDHQEISSPDHQQVKTIKSTPEPSQKSANLDASFDKQPECESDQLTSKDSQQLKTMKNANEPGTKSTNLDASFDKRSDKDSTDVLSPDSQNIDASKQLNEPGSNSTKLDASFDKQPEIESNQLTSKDSQQLKTTKNANEPGTKSTNLDASFDKQPEIESNQLTSKDSQQLKTMKNANEPGSNSTKLNTTLSKQPDTDSADVLSPDHQQVKTTKSTSEPSQKSTKLDTTLSKPDVSDHQEIIAPDQQHSKSEKTTTSPSKKSTKLDASFEKPPHADSDSANLSDIQHDDTSKMIKEPSQRLIGIDAAFDKTPVPEDVSIKSLEAQKELTRKSIHPASHQTTKLDAELNQPTEFKKVLSPDNQQSKASKTTKLDADLKKKQIRGEREQSIRDVSVEKSAHSQKEESIPTTQPDSDELKLKPKTKPKKPVSKQDESALEMPTVDASLSREELQETTKIADDIPVAKQMASKRTKSSKQIDDKLGVKEVDTQDVGQLPTPIEEGTSQDIHDKKSSELPSKQMDDEQIKKRELETSHKKSLKSPVQQKSIDTDAGLEESSTSGVDSKSSDDKKGKLSIKTPKLSGTPKSDEVTPDLSGILESPKTKQFESSSLEPDKRDELSKQSELESKDKSGKKTQKQTSNDDQTKLDINMANEEDSERMNITMPDLEQESGTKQLKTMSKKSPKSTTFASEGEDESQQVSLPDKHKLQKKTPKLIEPTFPEQQTSDEVTSDFAKQYSADAVKTGTMDVDDKEQSLTKDVAEIQSIPPKKLPKKKVGAKDIEDAKQSTELKTSFDRKQETTPSSTLHDDTDLNAKKPIKLDDDLNQTTELKELVGEKQQSLPDSGLIDDKELINNADLNVKKPIKKKVKDVIGQKDLSVKNKDDENVNDVISQQKHLPDSTLLYDTDLTSKKKIEDVRDKIPDQTQEDSFILLDDTDLSVKKKVENVGQQEEDSSILLKDTDLNAKKLPKKKTRKLIANDQQEEEPSSLLDNTDLSSKKKSKDVDQSQEESSTLLEDTDLSSKKLPKKKVEDVSQKEEEPSVSTLIDDTLEEPSKKPTKKKVKDVSQQEESSISTLPEDTDLISKKLPKKKVEDAGDSKQSDVISQQEKPSVSTLIDDTLEEPSKKPTKKKVKDVRDKIPDQQEEEDSSILLDNTDLSVKKKVEDVRDKIPDQQQQEEPSISTPIDETSSKKLPKKKVEDFSQQEESVLLDNTDLSSKKPTKKKVKDVSQQEEDSSILLEDTSSKKPIKLDEDRKLTKDIGQQDVLLGDTLEEPSKKLPKKKVGNKIPDQQQEEESSVLIDTSKASSKKLTKKKLGNKTGDQQQNFPSSTSLDDSEKSTKGVDQQQNLPDSTLIDENLASKKKTKNLEDVKQATELKASFDQRQESLSDSTLHDDTLEEPSKKLSKKKPGNKIVDQQSLPSSTLIEDQSLPVLDDIHKDSVDIELKSKKPKEESITLQTIDDNSQLKPAETAVDTNLKKKSDKDEQSTKIPDTQLSKTTKKVLKPEQDVPNNKDQTLEKLAATQISPALSKEQSKEKMIVRMPETVTESSTWSSPKKPPTVPQSAASDVSGKFGSEHSGSGTPSSSTTQSKYDARRLREERASTPDNFKFVQLRKVQRVQKPVKQEVVEQPIKPKFNPKRKMISTSVGGVVVASVKLMASPEPKLSIYHGEDYMEESENLKIIVDKDRWAYTICLCIYNVSAQLSGQLSLVATNELGSDKCLLFIDVSDAGKLNIGELPSIECNVADRVDALIDEDVKLQFKVRSILPPEVWIEQNGVQLSPELLTVDTEGETTTVTFEIRKCKATDKAIYKCCVINKYGSSSFTVYLNVQTKVDQSPKTPTTPIEPTRLRRKNKPGSLTIPKEINSLYGDPSVKVSLTNVTTELSATNDYAATDSSSPIKEVMSATVSKSVDASHNRSRRKGASRYTFNYKRTQSAPAHQISGEMKEMEDELNASNKSSMDKDSEPASTNQHVLDELKKELDMAKIVDDVVDDKKSKKPPKIPSPQKDEVSHHIEEVSKTPIDSEVPKIEEGLQPKQMKNQSEQTPAPPKVKAKKTKTSKDETTQILADFNKTSIETQTMINAPEYPYSFVEHTTVPTKDKGVFEESSLTLPPDDYSAVDSEQQTKLSDQLEIEPIQEAIELPDASKSIKKRKVKKISEDLEKQTSIDFEFNRDENEEKELLMALNQKESETSHIKLSRSRLSEEDVLEQDLLEDAKRKQELKDKFGKDREEILDESDQLKDASKRLKKVPKDVKSKDEDILKPADFVDDQTDLESIKLDSADKLPKKLPKPETGDKEDFGGIQLKPVIKRSQKESESSEVESYKLKPTQFDEKSTIDDKDSISLKKVPTDQNNDERSLKSSDTSKSLKQAKKEQIDDDPKLKDDSKLPKSLPTIGDGGQKSETPEFEVTDKQSTQLPKDQMDDGQKLKSIKLDDDSELKDASKLPKKLPKKKVEDEGGLESIQLKPVIKRSQKESDDVEDYKLKPTQFDEKALVDGNRESISLKKVPADQNNDERSLKSSDFESKDSSDVKPKAEFDKDSISLKKVSRDAQPKDNDGQELKTIDLEPKDDDGHNLKSTDLDSKDSSDSLKKVSRDVKPKEEFDKNSISLKKVSRDVKPKDDDKEIISLKKVPKDDGHNLKSTNFDSEPKDVISTIDSDQISSEQKLKSPDFDSEPKDSSDSLNKSPKDVKSTIDSDSEPKVSLKKVPTESTIDSDSEPKVSPKKSPKEDVQKPKSPDFEPKVSLKKVPTESTTDDKDTISLNKAPKAEFDDDSLSKSSKLGDDSASKVMDNIDSLKPKDAGDKSSMDDEKLLKKISKPKVDDDDSIKHDKSLKALPETGADQDNLSKLDDATTFDSKSLKKSPKRIEDSKHKLEEVPKDDQLTKSTISNEKLKKKPKTLAEQASNLDDVYSTAPESQIDKPKTKLKKKKVKQPSDDTPQPMTKDEILEDHKKDPFFISEEVTPSSKISDSVDAIDDTQQPTTKEEPIQFIKSLEPSTIGHVGEVIELSVELSRPAQEFKWLFNQREVPLSSDEYRVNVKGNQLSLEILNPTFDMSGTYSVVADDAVTSTQLDFHGQPVLEDSADSAIELNAKDDLKLKCNFKANPKPDIQILLNNEPLDDPEAFVEVETDTITLSRPTVTRKNSGIYSFVVRNTYGKAEKHVKVVVCDVPEAPQNLKVESFGSDFVEISWMPPESGSSSLLHYRIEMKEAKRRVFQRAGQVPANTTRFRIEGLDIDRLYMFKVAAINKFGTGEFCTPVEQTTNVPFEAPQIEKPPRIVSIDEKMCKLEWSPCSNTGGSPIYSYDVYMREGDSGDWVKVNDDEVFVPSFSIKDRLEPGKSYSFKIEATNEAGISSDSNVPTESVLCPKTSVDIFDAPTVEVTSPNSVNVKWDRPADLPADQKLKSVVFYKSEQSPVWNKLLTTDDELEISDLKPELAYIFRVETELPDSTTLSSGETSPVSLTTAEKPRITKPLKDVNAIKSNELRLEVQALSEPAPSFEWTKDGREVSGAQISNDGTSSVLTISFANDADQGLYTCKVTNVHGSVESSAQISVKQPPINILTAFPESLNTTTGTELELACELSHEDATVNWLKNGQPLFESDRIQFVEVGTKRQLIIKNAEKEDSADYVCVSTDGNSRARCKVSVKEPEAHVKFGPEDQTITSIGETAAVECELTSPVETLCWLQNGRPIDLNSPKYTVVNDGLKCTLKIADFDKSAVGDYVLQLPNGELSVPANLQLKIPAKIEVDFDELFAHAGKELSFAVRVSGFPIPAFNATLNGVPLKDFALIDDIDEENIKVTIKSAKPEHAGELTLKVKNDSNEDSKSIPVKVASVPQQPANVSATLVNEDSCEVRWSPNKEDENAPIAEYIIERKAGDQTRWRQCGQIDANAELSFIAEELPPDELIMFRVIAVNEVGRGKPSKTVDVVTEPKREEQVGEEIAQIESALQERIEEESKPTATLKDNGVELTWKAMENVKLYAIERRSSNNGTWVQIACTDRNWFVDRTIKEPGNYSYRVIAHFDGAEQKYSEPTNEVSVEEKDISADEDDKLEEHVSGGDEMSPSAKLTPDGVEVKWTAIGNVKLYAIERRKSGDSIWVQLDCVRFNSFVDQTIKEPGQYVYRVVAQLKDGSQLISSPTNKVRIEESDLRRQKDIDGELDKTSAEQADASLNLVGAKSSVEDQSANAKIKKKPEAKVLPKRRGEQLEELEEDVQTTRPKEKSTIDDDDVENLDRSVDRSVEGFKKKDESEDAGKTVGLKSRQDDNVGFGVRGRRRRNLSDQENVELGGKGSDSDASAKRDASPPIVVPKIIPKIEVLDSPTELTADEEAEAVFEFKFDQLPEGITISWLKDGRPLNTVGRRKFQSSVEDGVVRLKVNNLSSDDEGDYSCRINFGDAPLAECSTKLDVKKKIAEEPLVESSSLLEPVDFRPKRVKRRALSDIEPPVPLRLLRELQDDEVKLGGSTTLSVTYSSSIVPEFKFFKNGKQIINLPGWYTIKQDGGRLLCTIENATLDDEGEWMLVVETPQSTIETKCRITVKVPPKPVEIEKPPAHDAFESALPAITRIRQRLDSETSSASSPASKRLRQIEEEPKERGEPPKFHHLLEDLSAREGEHVILSVTSTTIPEPNVQWYRSGILIERTNSNYIIKVETGRFEFEILSCSKQDNAEWMAVGETRFGRCESKCVLTVLDARRQVEPYFTIGLQNQTCSLGSMMILEVNVRGIPDPDLQWFKNEQLLQHGSEYRIVGNNNLNTLTILEAAKTHAGMYEVVAENAAGKAQTSCVVTVNDPTHGSSKAEETQIPIVRMPLLPVREIPEGTELNLVCTITGSPLPKIEWQKDDQAVFGAYFRYDNGVATMTILRAELTHSGVYTAIGSNKFGSTRTSCVLYVKPSADSNRTAPKFEDPLTNVSLLTGKELCLECRVVCKPQSSLKLIWYKDGIKMLPSNRLLQYVDRRGVVRLNLMDCRLEDAGEYGVQAENSLGQDFTHCMVRITDASTRKSSAKALHYKPDSRAPLVTRPLQDCTVHVGNQGLLECEVQAASGATAEWTQNGQLLAESRTLRSYFDGRLALLKIFNADKSHEGEYQLFIEDKYGQTTSNAMVTVEDVDQEHLPHMPEFTKTLETQLIESEGSSVSLCCEVQGLPTPSLIWLLNGKTLQLSSEIQAQIDGNTHTLSIYPFGSKYCGTITAIAKNIYGEVHSSTDIQLKKND